jgi:tRNA modification GTPase
MRFELHDTIAAIASPPGGAARGIVRVSGPQTAAVLAEALRDAQGNDCRAALCSARRPRVWHGTYHLRCGTVRLPCAAYWWPTQRSYTRQPLAELHTLGSPPLLGLLLRDVCERGARTAAPGEFTLRAFLSGRLDLTQAEAVLGVIEARDPAQLHTALRQMAGGLSVPLQALREALLDLLAHLEAGLDFVEEDIEFITPAQLAAQLDGAQREVARLLQQIGTRHHSDELPRVVLLGTANVGKSSLFNALAGGEYALVSPWAGTTRDFLTAELQVRGRRFLLVDTAGTAPQASGPLEAAAQHQRTEQQRDAALRLLCLDVSRPLSDAERTQLATPDPRRLVVLTKVDLPPADDAWPADALRVSSRTHQGLEELLQRIGEQLGEQSLEPAAVVSSTAMRCRVALESALQSLRRAGELVQQRGGEELVAAEVRAALNDLGEVVGAVYTDDILDRIFSRFCIGK